jgi:hypothetical protein
MVMIVVDVIFICEFSQKSLRKTNAHVVRKAIFSITALKLAPS